ncbi:uncharacterized protein Sap-r [Anabrus simplex]|uniref:uncharacterized protein Sap-r n=1 Tax=Anabrus simplex TaxID=316456 RepID=UPI0034DD2434
MIHCTVGSEVEKMKRGSFLLCVLYIAVLTAVGEGAARRAILGSKECTWGPSYWCVNITNAKNCGAVKHCIQTVWEHQKLPPDNDNVCQICKEMVKEARDQLESNQTQEDLRQVLEGSCKLIPIRIVADECMKLADDFIPELVETLASQMNPQVVCSVAGLCNSARIDSMLQEGEGNKYYTSYDSVVRDCEDCNQIAKQMEAKFRSTPKDDVLHNLIEACGFMGSFSDGCSAILITHFDSLYDHLLRHLEADGLCHLSGMCQYKFHTHAKKSIEVIHESTVGMVRTDDEDLPCELCEQLIVHLRDILVANTTEQEFELVLKGVCKQFKEFRSQCLSIVDEYYAVIYDFLVNNLKSKEICSMIGICPRPGGFRGPLWPLVPQSTAQLYEARKALAKDRETMKTPPRVIGMDEANSYKVYSGVKLGQNGIGVRVQKPVSLPPPLPIERMMPQTLTYFANKEGCALCEYVLHYLQLALTAPASEAEIKKLVDDVCEHLPSTISDQCKEFVDTYGDAVVALLAQEIDPSVVCPKMGLCPGSQVMLDLTHMVKDKPTCPLCLFAVEELINKLKDNKTEEEILEALDNLCSDLPKSLAGECRTFVENYSEQLVDMLVADFTPQEVCTYLKLCDAPAEETEVEILSNEIPQGPDHLPLSQSVGSKESTSCVLCEFVMSKIDAALKDRTVEEEIKQVVHDVCNYMPRTVIKECNDFVNQYADLIITLLSQSLDPKEVCTEIALCQSKAKVDLTGSLEECAVCDAVLSGLDHLLADPAIEDDTANAMQKVCSLLPAKDVDQCKSMIKVYGPSILNLIARHTDTHLICEKIGLCLRDRQVVNLLGGKKCTWGPGYWCVSEEHAKSCGALAHCQEKVWMAEKPSA